MGSRGGSGSRSGSLSSQDPRLKTWTRTYEHIRLSVVEIIKSEKPLDDDIGLMVGDILEMIYLEEAFSFVPCQANRVARGLTKSVLNNSQDCFWMESVHLCLEMELPKDVPY
ncbi:hypothetical protein QYF36_013020 [Acer negundo]|nr:hypothetical protein QYF36_013020 [Acer negundo]